MKQVKGNKKPVMIISGKEHAEFNGVVGALVATSLNVEKLFKILDLKDLLQANQKIQSKRGSDIAKEYGITINEDGSFQAESSEMQKVINFQNAIARLNNTEIELPADMLHILSKREFAAIVRDTSSSINPNTGGKIDLNTYSISLLRKYLYNPDLKDDEPVKPAM